MEPANNNVPGDMPHDQSPDGQGNPRTRQGHSAAGTHENKPLLKQYLVPMLAVIAFMMVFGFILTIFAGTLQIDHDIQTLLREEDGLIIPGNRIRSVSSFSQTMNATTGCGSHPTILTSSVPATTQTAAPLQATANGTASAVNVSGGSVLATSTALAVNGTASENPATTSMVTVTVTVMATEVIQDSAAPGSATSTADIQSDEFTSTTTVTIGLTSFVTVTATLNMETTTAPISSLDQSMSSGSDASVTTAAGSPITAEPVSTTSGTATAPSTTTASRTTTRKVTTVISGITKTVTVTETMAAGLLTGASATAGTLTQPAVTANVTWNSSHPFPHGPVSTSLFPSISGGSKPKTKGGNSGNGASGVSCIVMLAAIAIGFFSI